MLLRNLEITGENQTTDILIRDGKINTVSNFTEDTTGRQTIDFDNAIAFPGLINSHDHLDFNLFPQLGNRLYASYVEWGRTIHKEHKEAINNVLKIPEALRVQWGIYKNLVNGVTTVVNHGAHLATNNDLITIFQECYALHSVRNERFWKYKLNKPFAGKRPYVIHVGEGIDYGSRWEIDKLVRWNFGKKEIIGVHGIAMNERQAPNFKGLVWCPASNYFLIGETAQINKLQHVTDIVFGTDSTLTAGWNLWEHLRLARSEHAVTDKELFNMLTTTAADLWQIKGCGSIKDGYDADIVVAKRKNNMSGYNAYFVLNPEDILMVIHKGNIRLFDAALLGQLDNGNNITGNFSKIAINGASKYIYGDLPGLMEQIKSHYPGVSFPFGYNKQE